MSLLLPIALFLSVNVDSTSLRFDDVLRNSAGRFEAQSGVYKKLKFDDTAVFDIVHDALLNCSILRVCGDNANGFYEFDYPHLNLDATPYVSWEWQVLRVQTNDSSNGVAIPIAVVFSTGGKLRREMICYVWSDGALPSVERWQRVRDESCVIFYKKLRGKQSYPTPWLPEVCHVKDDFLKMFGYVPKRLQVGFKMLNGPDCGSSAAQISPLKYSATLKEAKE